MAAGGPTNTSHVVRLIMSANEFAKFKKMVYEEVEKKKGHHMDLDQALHCMIFDVRNR